MAITQFFRTTFVCSVIVHTLLLMGFIQLAWWSAVIAGAIGLLPRKPAPPTYGLSFILLASGGLLGYFGLDLFVDTRSWASYLPVPAGICIASLVLLSWMLAAYRPNGERRSPVDRPLQNMLMFGLPLLLFLPSNDEYVVQWIAGVRLDLFQLGGAIAGFLSLIPSGRKHYLRQRVVLLMPTLVLLPLLVVVIIGVQGPIFSALGFFVPTFKGGANTGFSPSQRLKFSEFLKPSTKPVMRVIVAGKPSVYLAGSRHNTLDGETMTWLTASSESPDGTVTRGPSLVDSEFNTFDLHPNHQQSIPEMPQSEMPPSEMQIESLRRDDFLFIPLEASALYGKIQSIYQDQSQIWRAIFERGEDRRWRVSLNETALPEPVNEANLGLPDFWDEALMAKARTFRGADSASTVGRTLAYFTDQEYSLAVNFDREQPFHDFFLNEKPAFCFWYATATVLSLRANQVPARIVSGYFMGETLAKDIWIVRERDAHTWVEWQDEQGLWHTVDPTPASYAVFMEHYQTSQFNQWLHLGIVRLNAWWQAVELSDRFEDWMIMLGFGFLIVMFVREYRRVSRALTKPEFDSSEWQKIWTKFLKSSQLSNQSTWTITDYQENFPPEWNDEQRACAGEFLAVYQDYRFSDRPFEQMDQLKKLLKQIKRARP